MYPTGMTRSEVAIRIGRSVSTVRRLEGVELFPSTDGSGVHHFDEWEVRNLIASMREGLRLPNGMAKEAAAPLTTRHERDEPEIRKLEERVKGLESDLHELQGWFEEFLREQ